MITKIELENIEIAGYSISKFSVDLKPGLNLITTEYGRFIKDLFEYISQRMNVWYRCKRLFDVHYGVDKNDLSSITIHCDHDNKTLKYISTYIDNSLLTETILLDNELVYYWDYHDDDLQVGEFMSLGELISFDKISTDAKLLVNTAAGRVITQTINDYVFCNSSELESITNIKGKLNYGGQNRISELNKLYPYFGFDIRIDSRGNCVYESGSKVGIPIELQGSGFLKLLDIFTKIMYCKEENLCLVIQNYKDSLHPLVANRLIEYLKQTGLNIIVTVWL